MCVHCAYGLHEGVSVAQLSKCFSRGTLICEQLPVRQSGWYKFCPRVAESCQFWHEKGSPSSPRSSQDVCDTGEMRKHGENARVTSPKEEDIEGHSAPFVSAHSVRENATLWGSDQAWRSRPTVKLSCSSLLAAGISQIGPMGAVFGRIRMEKTTQFVVMCIPNPLLKVCSSRRNPGSAG